MNDTGYVEAAKDANGIALKGTAKRGTANRDLCVSELVLDVYGEAQVGENTYFTLADAMEAANDDDTIVLLDDVTVTDVAFILKSGVALDLNGNTLTVNNFLLTFDDVLQVIDSQNGVGKLVITKKNVCGDFADNNYLPLYDDGGYRFFAYEFCHLEEETGDDDKVKYWVGLGFANKAAYNLLISEDNADVDFGVNMTITKSDGFDEGLNWIFSDALMDEFVQKNVNGSKRMAVILTISGMTRLGDAQYTTKAILRSSVVDLAKNMDMMAQ